MNTKRRIMSKLRYVALSVGIACVFIFSALPYYLMTTISIPGWNIYWSYGQVQKQMFVLFPGMAFIGAVTTLKKKRNTVEDALLNLAAPFVVLLAEKAAQYHPILVLCIIAAICIFAVIKGVVFWLDDRTRRMGRLKKLRLIYYRTRECTYLFVFILTPLVVWGNLRESTESDDLLTQYRQRAEADSKIAKEDNKIELVSEDVWKSMDVEERFSEVTKMTTYFLQDLGVPGVDTFAVKKVVDGEVAWYSDSKESISYNITYLADASLEDMVYAAAHECHHRYEEALVNAVEILEKEGFDCTGMEYFQEALALQKADDEYYIDSLSSDTYHGNLMEKQAGEYAEKMVERMKSEGYLN